MAGCDKFGLEDGMKEKARFNGATGIVYCAQGNKLIVCDEFNNCLRKITMDGIIISCCLSFSVVKCFV